MIILYVIGGLYLAWLVYELIVNSGSSLARRGDSGWGSAA